MSGAAEPVDVAEPVEVPEPAEGRWVAVAWVDGRLLAVGPLDRQSATLGLLAAAEAYVGVERVGVAELVDPAAAAVRLASVRPKDAAGVLCAVPRDGRSAARTTERELHPTSTVQVAGNVATVSTPCHGYRQPYPRGEAVPGAWLRAVCGVCGTARVVEVQADPDTASGLRACWSAPKGAR